MDTRTLNRNGEIRCPGRMSISYATSGVLGGIPNSQTTHEKTMQYAWSIPVFDATQSLTICGQEYDGAHLGFTHPLRIVKCKV